ncbi:hypothetical protein BCR33DRAFT_456156 [Rhizoclosmatium globosum]|uniref:Uncharacterized protein n=1 Tax=Rhizoclosmatium globosum TaxID=329046 RepID=A0A1Y2CWT1_9FUNG|nr:hypothetical protein BCR33DRAFT_456156 [Rhizoclosmatium globosum]|eukprot:ORY51483.1 hypothetical protein BCR33DRAFT_456156 [Rhizoclosmatium globosum]
MWRSGPSLGAASELQFEGMWAFRRYSKTWSILPISDWKALCGSSYYILPSVITRNAIIPISLALSRNFFQSFKSNRGRSKIIYYFLIITVGTCVFCLWISWRFESKWRFH